MPCINFFCFFSPPNPHHFSNGPSLNEDLLDAPWHFGEIFDDLDDAYDYWRNLYDSIANENAPMRKKRVRERDVCFMSKEWKAAIRNKRKYAIQFAKDRTPKKL